MTLTPISPSNFKSLGESSEFHQKFDSVFLSTAHAQKIGEQDFLQNCVHKDSVIYVETPKYILDLKDEQVENVIKTIKQMAKDQKLSSIESSNDALLLFQYSE